MSTTRPVEMLLLITDENSLRDWFAGMAMQGVLSNSHVDVRDFTSVDNPVEEIEDKWISEACYILADAMLEARKGKEVPDA